MFLKNKVNIMLIYYERCAYMLNYIVNGALNIDFYYKAQAHDEMDLYNNALTDRNIKEVNIVLHNGQVIKLNTYDINYDIASVEEIN